MSTKYSYFAILRAGDTPHDASGIIRRRMSNGNQVDESLRSDLTWQLDSAIIEWEYGDVGAQLVQISEEEALALIERFREKWATQGY